MPAPISFKCSECKGDISVDATLSGFNVSCPYCGKQQPVPVVVSSSIPVGPTQTKIRLKKDADKQPSTTIAAPPSDADNDMEEEIEYIVVEEPPQKGRRVLVIAVAAIVLIAGILVFFGVRSCVANAREVQAAQLKIQEESARKAALEAKEAKLKPVWEDAMAIVEKAKRTKNEVSSATTLLEGLRQRDFAATKYEAMATEEIQRLNILKLSIAEEKKRAEAESAREEEAKRLQAQQAALQAQLSEQAASKANKPAAAPAAPVFNRQAALKSLAKLLMKGDWKAAESSVKTWSDKSASASVAPVLAALADQPRIIASSFRDDVNKDVTIALADGTSVEARISAIRGDSVQAMRKIDKASIAFDFNDASLSVDERVARLSKVSHEAGAIFKVFARTYLDQTPEDAYSALASIPSDNLMGGLKDSLLPEIKEIFAAKGYVLLLARLRLDASMSEGQLRDSVSKLKLSSQAQKIELKGLIDDYSSAFRSTAYYKTAASKLATIGRGLDALKVVAPAAAPAPAKPQAGASSSSGSKGGGLGGVSDFGGGGGGLGGVGGLGDKKK